MTKTMRIKIICFILALFVAIFATGTVFAWFSNQQWDMVISGNTIGAYFAYGDGTEGAPFGITHPQHMYNLAWLQNRGFFNINKNQEKYYFELGNNVDMRESGKAVVIPPIGNNKFPFTGEFIGHGHAISNLIVSTNRDVLDDTYSDAVFANAVGFFGMTGEDSVISNFILDDPTVEVADDKDNDIDTAYDEISEDEDSNDTLAAGLAVGYVAGKVHSIGVMGGTLAVRRQGYDTFNSILGNLSADALKNNNVTGAGSGTSGGGGEHTGSNFGATFDVDGIWARMEQIADNNNASWRLPQLSVDRDAEGNIIDMKMYPLELMPFTVTDASTYEGENAKEVIADDNIGYLLGDNLQANSKKYEFGDPLVEPEYENNAWTFPDGTTPANASEHGVIPRWIYKQSTTYVSATGYNFIEPLTDDEYDSLSVDIIENIPKTNGWFKLDALSINEKYQNTDVQLYYYDDEPGAHAWRTHGQITWNGQTYGEGFTLTDYNGYTIDENGVYYSSTSVNGTDLYFKIGSDGYLYREDELGKFYAPTDNFVSRTLIRSFDNNGDARDVNGNYLYAYKFNDQNWLCGEFITIDGTQYIYDNGFIGIYKPNGWTTNIITHLDIDSIDEHGYAMYGSEWYYDASGVLLDEHKLLPPSGPDGTYELVITGTMFDQWGVYVGEDGYFCRDEWDGTKLVTDSNGVAVRAYGYQVIEVDGECYLSLDGKTIFTINNYGTTMQMKPKAGTPFKVLTRNDFPNYLEQQNIKVKTGSFPNDAIKFKQFKGGIALPNNGLWFKPITSGKIRLIVFSDKDEGSGGGFALIKLRRNSATKENPFTVDTSSSTGNIEIVSTTLYATPYNVLVYFEIGLTDDEVADGRYEFWLAGASGQAPPYFLYMDLGASSTGTVPTTTPTDKADTTKQVTAIDFIYGDVYIAQDGDNAGSFLDPKNNDNIYVETGTMLTFGGNGAIVAFYYRSGTQPDSDGKTIYAAYNSQEDNKLVSSNESKATITSTGKDVTITPTQIDVTPWTP